MKVLPKDFLSIEDVAYYLEKIGYSYDLQMQYEYQRLFSDIYDLINQKKITAVFHHYGKLYKEIEFFEMDEDDRGRPIKIPLHEEQYIMNADDYFYIEREYIKDLLLNEKEVHINRFVDKYGETISISQDENIFYRLSDSIKISIRDIRIPRCELDSLFQEDVLTNITDKPFFDEDLSPKNSAYCLIAVLKDLLLNPNIGAYHFSNDTDKSTNQPTQAGLATHIESMNIKGLKARNINGILSEANRLLDDAKKH